MNKSKTMRYTKSALFILLILLALSLAGCAQKSKESLSNGANVSSEVSVEVDKEVTEEITTEVSEEISAAVSTEVSNPELSVEYELDPTHEDLLKFGNIIAPCDSNSFLEMFEYGDVVNVEFSTGEVQAMPVCGSYNEVSAGSLLVMAKSDYNKISIARSNGALAYDLGFVENTPDGSNYPYQVVESKFPKTVKISMLEKGGYLNGISLSSLELSKNRNDYPDLTDEEFGNFRNVTAGDIAPGILYRSSSPIDAEICRNEYVDRATENHKIKTVIDMTDNEADAKDMPGYADTYFSKCNVLFEPTSMSLRSDSFDENMADCIRFIADNDGPYLIHCQLGQDRTGILCAMLESLCNADYKEIEDDFSLTFDLLYNIDEQRSVSESQKEAIKAWITESLSYAYGTEVTYENHYEKTKEYLNKIGLSDEELGTVIRKLTGSTNTDY